MMKHDKEKADKLAIIIGKMVDELIDSGYYCAGDITYALCIVVAITMKVKGQHCLSSAKALICEIVDVFWRTDEIAQLRRKIRNN